MASRPYHVQGERDACGIGFVADARGRSSRMIVEAALGALRRVKHRGAVAADAKTGDGAGILLPIPGRFFARAAAGLGLAEPDPEWIGIAMVFAEPAVPELDVSRIVEAACRAEAIDVIAWRTVPVEPGALGDFARATMPRIAQAMLLRPAGLSREEAERNAHRARRRAEAAIRKAGLAVSFPSFGFSTVTYKGLVAADQLGELYPDLRDPDVEAHFAIFHQRYSTNTLPTWERAQPFRLICHNGEINTIAGNVNRMRCREGRLGKWSLLEEEVLRPVIDESGSDSAMLD
ncbi:MAG TPA: glutamate synthase subunit alpha, partial [Actinomycetota bacterium]|nr:glutamate synthase subunit alpha [Actinomycetota bacterium]